MYKHPDLRMLKNDCYILIFPANSDYAFCPDIENALFCLTNKLEIVWSIAIRREYLRILTIYQLCWTL